MSSVCSCCTPILLSPPSFHSSADGADGKVAATPESILEYSANIIHWGAFRLISKLLKAVPSLFKLIQGGPNWAAKLRDEQTGEVPYATEAVIELVTLLDGFAGPAGKSNREFVIAEVAEEASDEQESLASRAAGYGEMTEDEIAAGKVSPRICRRCNSSCER